MFKNLTIEDPLFRTRQSRWVLLVVFLAIFVNSYVFIKEPAEVYLSYPGIALLLLLWLFRFGLPPVIIQVFGILLFAGVLNIILGNNTIGNFVKIFLGVFMSYLFFYYIMKVFEFKVEELYRWYLKGCVILSLIGLFQFFSFLVGFRYGYDLSWILNKGGFIGGGNFGIRINALFPEPTYLACTLSPAMFVAMYNLFRKQQLYLNRWQSALVIVVFTLSFSGLAFAAFLIAGILLLVNFGLVRYILLFVPVLMISFSFMYNNVEEFRQRYDSTVEIFRTGQFKVGETHGSSVILYNNYHVALENFKSNFLFGTGLGSHQVAFEQYSITKGIKTWGFDLNSQDANSMLLRLISETGLFGTILFLVLFFKCYVKRHEEDPDFPPRFWIISNGIFIMIALNLLRQGHYFLNGFPFFVWLYYYNYLDYTSYMAEKAEKHKQQPSAGLAGG
ncbi:MAG: O-antigen ligase family protein [Bacteroidia bacterium]|nr:O-antigen ligase family protein [Bacteroidia bacterium]